MKNYQCKKCGTTLQNSSTPSSGSCPSGGTHTWSNLGEVGDKNFQCKKCGTLIKSKSTPGSGSCRATGGGTHSWSKL